MGISLPVLHVPGLLEINPTVIQDGFSSDQGNWLDGDLTAAAMTISNGRGIWTPALGSELVNNGDMETGDPPSNWTAVGATLAASADTPSGSGQSLSVTDNGSSPRAQQNITMPAGIVYAEAAYKIVLGDDCRVRVDTEGPLLTDTSGWLIHRQTQTIVSAGVKGLYLYTFTGEGGVTLYDNVSVKSVTANTLWRVQPIYYISYIEVDIWRLYFTQSGLVFYKDADNYICAFLQTAYGGATQVILRKNVAGVITDTSPVTVTGSGGGVLRLTPNASFDSFTVTYRGTAEISNQAIADFPNMAGRWFAGLYATYNAGDPDMSAFDNFEVAILSTTAPYTIVSTGVLVDNDGGASRDWVGRARLVDDGTKWMCVYRTASGHGDTSTARIHIIFSTDSGDNWTAEDTFTDGNPVTNAPFSHSTANAANCDLCQAPNGDLLLWIDASDARDGIDQWRSSDGGASWSFDGKIGADDEQYLGLCCAVVDSTIYLPTWRDPGSDSTRPYFSRLLKSVDNGANWTTASDITEAGDDLTNEFAIIELDDGSLLAALRHTDETTTYLSTSNDGSAWSAVSEFGQPQAAQTIRMRKINTRLYVLLREREEETVQYPSLMWSDDDGTTWQGPYRLNASAVTDCGYLDALERTDSNLYIVYYSGTDSAAKLYYAIVQRN